MLSQAACIFCSTFDIYTCAALIKKKQMLNHFCDTTTKKTTAPWRNEKLLLCTHTEN